MSEQEHGWQPLDLDEVIEEQLDELEQEINSWKMDVLARGVGCGDLDWRQRYRRLGR